jgi:hypothetical protein
LGSSNIAEDVKRRYKGPCHWLGHTAYILQVDCPVAHDLVHLHLSHTAFQKGHIRPGRAFFSSSPQDSWDKAFHDKLNRVIGILHYLGNIQYSQGE